MAEGRLREMEAKVLGGGSTAVVLLHGQPGSAGDWRRVAPLLEDRYTVIVPDRPGYGRTGGPATGFAGNARAVMRLLDRLGIGAAVLVGHSWAGGVGLAAAASDPDRVAGLVLVSSVGPGEHLGWDDRLLAAPVLGEVIAAASIGGLGLVLGRNKVQSVASRRLDGRAREAVDAFTRLTRGGSRVWRSFVTEQRAMFSELHGLGRGLSDIRSPTAVVHGRTDRLIPPEVGEELAAAIPGASLRLVPDVGHLLPQDRPDEVARAVNSVTGPPAPPVG